MEVSAVAAVFSVASISSSSQDERLAVRSRVRMADFFGMGAVVGSDSSILKAVCNIVVMNEWILQKMLWLLNVAIV